MPQEEEEILSPGAQLMRAPGFNLCILATMGFATTIDAHLFKKRVEQTLIKHPRFSSLLIVRYKNGCKYSWKRTSVDVENHVFMPDLDADMESPDQFVEDFMSMLSRNPLPQTKPLWEIYILNVKTSDANSTVIFKIHHSLGDGVSLISLLMACAKKVSDPESLPLIKPLNKQKHKFNDDDHIHKGLMMQMKEAVAFVWTMLLVVFNTLVDFMWFMATIMFLKDGETPIKAPRGIDPSTKQFIHRIVDLEEVRIVKTAMNVTINDVVVATTEAGLTRYLNRRYEKNRENGTAETNKKISTNSLPRNLCLRSAVCFNLRPTPTIEDLAAMMENEEDLKGMWGNKVGIVLLPFTIAVQEDPLTHLRRAKATMDRKKLSLAHKCVVLGVKILMSLLGTKIAAAVSEPVFRNTTLTFSNVVGPEEEISLFGHPVCYIAPSAFGFPQALIIHYQTYANKLIICIGADEKLIPNPHQLCDDLVKSLQNFKEAVIKRGLAKAS